ncbi:hypothetical protein DFH07DRAFT_804898 [Mycena maculata]|uniref:F-box domain-containing protein n=1 Tax=Mycena maculata TaxID=230809 RepID=A0AAD7NQ81_9AGAR|nr:hypothetical protein DFH07DRAFT_804898 [Mycena maculata]
MAPVLGSTLQFSELVDDVILLVLVHCDISSVLAVGQTSKQLHRLASEKYLWLSLVTDLARRGFIDRPPDDDLRDLSKDQLVGLVKKIVVGPRPLRHKNKVLESRRITLPQGHTTDPNAFGRTLRLLPGGKYVLLFRRRISLECWSIADQKMIWTHVCSVKGVVVEDFAVQLTDERHFVIMTSHYHSSAQRNFAEFTAVDLASGRSRFIRASYPEHYGYPLVSIMHLAICGDIAAIYCADEHFMLLLINWRTGSYAMVQLSVDDDVYFFTNVMCVALVPHYAILVLPSKNGDYAFSVVPLLAFPWSTDTVDLQNAGSGQYPSCSAPQPTSGSRRSRVLYTAGASACGYAATRRPAATSSLCPQRRSAAVTRARNRWSWAFRNCCFLDRRCIGIGTDGMMSSTSRRTVGRWLSQTIRASRLTSF